jgi:protein-arginine kinase activator protein McsA
LISVNELEEMLKMALANEKYELAARLRDNINKRFLKDTK